MINEIKTGEIININKREYVLFNSSVGGTNKKRPALILLKNFIFGTPKKLRGCLKKTPSKKFKTIKLTNIKKC